MSRIISRAEGWEKAYEAFQDINFSAFDYDSVKQSLLDYIKDYFPEQFNDFIESSEFIAIIETFAYISELLAYRIDMNTHENFISVAQRKQSVLRLAKLVSYNASRNMPGRGLVKITSVSTTEPVFDARSQNLSNQKILWNDSNNENWKEQFILLMNQVTQQRYGTVSPSDRIQVDDVLFELYTLNNIPQPVGVFKYSTQVGGTTIPMELVPVSLNHLGPYERRPEIDTTFSILYGSDGVGDSSDTTGFFVFTKQGTLQKDQRTFDGITPNQSTLVEVADINDIDVWVNNIHPSTGKTIKNTILDARGVEQGVAGEWDSVDVTNTSNVLFNTNKQRNKYEIETLENDKIRIIFGDGEFSDIPNGTFDIWYRTSINDDVVIPRSSVVNKTATFSYRDSTNTKQTFTFTYSLTSTITNAAKSEDIESIRRMAPSVFYTQSRMVNGRDYNTYMLQDASILKTRAFNRTYAGDSKYLTWHDPSSHYEDVKIFGDDMSLVYHQSTENITVPNGTTPGRMLTSFMQPYLSHAGVIIYHQQHGLNIPRHSFLSSEMNEIDQAIKEAEISNGGFPIKLTYLPTWVNGTQGIDFGGTVVGTNPVEMSVSYLLYTATVTFDSVHLFDLRYEPTAWPATTGLIREGTSTELHTYDELIADINVMLNPTGYIAIVEGNLQFVSRTTGVASMVVINDQGLFKYLANGNSQPAVVPPVQGTNENIWKPFPNQTLFPAELKNTFNIELINTTWRVSYQSLQLLCESPTTNFWFTNDGNQVISGNTLNPSYDKIVILSANNNRDHNGILPEDKELEVVGGVTSNIGVNNGINNFTKLSLIIKDKANQVDVDKILLTDLIDPEYVITTAPVDGIFVLPSSHAYPYGFGDLLIFSDVQNRYLIRGIEYREVGNTLGEISTTVEILDHTLLPTPSDDKILRVLKRDYVYSTRVDSNSEWVIVNNPSSALMVNWYNGNTNINRERGRSGYNFLWKHTSPRSQLIDPSSTNITDTYILTRGYYTQLRDWIRGKGPQPVKPTPFQLRVDYGYLLESKMISDTVVLQPGNIKLIFGSKSKQQLQAKILIVRNKTSSMTDNEIKVKTVDAVIDFFDINQWEFGETFNFSELSAIIHAKLAGSVNSVVLVPLSDSHFFGDLYQVFASEDEIILPDISVSDVELVDFFNPTNLRQGIKK